MFVIRTLDRRASVRARRGDWQGRTVIGWAGMRGAVSLAAALALPANFPERDLLGKIEDDGFEDRSLAYQNAVREVLEAQRREIVRLRNEGTISNDVMHRIERDLDLEDERLEI